MFDRLDCHVKVRAGSITLTAKKRRGGCQLLGINMMARQISFGTALTSLPRPHSENPDPLFRIASHTRDHDSDDRRLGQGSVRLCVKRRRLQRLGLLHRSQRLDGNKDPQVDRDVECRKRSIGRPSASMALLSSMVARCI